MMAEDKGGPEGQGVGVEVVQAGRGKRGRLEEALDSDEGGDDDGSSPPRKRAHRGGTEEVHQESSGLDSPSLS